jgi:hypothetical protein
VQPVTDVISGVPTADIVTPETLNPGVVEANNVVTNNSTSGIPEITNL